MYINPNTDIYLCRDVQCDPDYRHTYYFGTAAAQLAFFTAKVKRAFDKNTYQRVRRGVCRIGCPADDLYDCNYLFFRNTAYGNKIFYAFVRNVEYVNDDVCDVFYEIDVIQTYLFDIVFDECFVERQTAETDGFGEHLEAESVEFGPIVYSGSSKDLHCETPGVLVCTSFLRSSS